MRAIYLCLATGAAASQMSAVQKVVQLLEDLKSKVKQETEESAAACQEYYSWAAEVLDEKQDSVDTLASKIDDSKALIDNYSAQSEAAGTKVVEISQQLSANDGDQESATKVRKQEHADFQSAEMELTEAIDTLSRAKRILKRTGLTQTTKAQLLQMIGGIESVVESEAIATDDSKKLTALIQGADTEDESEDGSSLVQTQGAPQAAAYESHSGNIIEMIGDLEGKARKQLNELRKQEAESKHAYDMLMQKLTASSGVFNRDLSETKGVKAENEEGLGKSKQALAEQTAQQDADQKMYNSVKAELAQKQSDCDQKAHDGAEEQQTVGKAIEILSGDGFQKSLGSVKLFVQTNSHTKDVRDEIAKVIQDAAKKYHSLALGQLATRTRVGDDPFGKVRGLISDMIARLEKQAAEEANKNQWCNEQTATTTEKRDKLSSKVDMYAARQEKRTADIAMLKQDMASMAGELAEMNKAFAEATDLRNKERNAYTANMQELDNVQQNLQAAIETLNEYFANEDTALIQAGSSKHTDAAASITQILETAVSDFAKSQAEAKAAESAAEHNYNEMKDAYEVDKASKEASLKADESSVQTMQSSLEDTKGDRQLTQNDLDATLEYLGEVRKKCTHTPMTFEERQQRRQNEIKSLEEALRILDEETAGDAFMQVRAIRHY